MCVCGVFVCSIINKKEKDMKVKKHGESHGPGVGVILTDPEPREKGGGNFQRAWRNS